MKNAMRCSVLALSILGAASCSPGGQNQEEEINSPEEVKEQKKQTPDSFDAEFKDGMVGKVFNNYLEINHSLVNSDLENAKTAASNLAESFEPDRGEMKNLAQQMASAEDLESLRKHFAAFSMAAEPLFSESISAGKIYKQYCPMAFEGEGAFWLSDAQEIKNPYFGEKMLRCGSTKQIITKK